MTKNEVIQHIHKNVSSVLFTTQEFNERDTEKLVDELISLGVLSVDDCSDVNEKN